MVTREHHRLLKDDEFVCCDTPLIREYYEWALTGFVGSVLVTGLGLGIAALYLCELPEVTSVTVVENDPEIIAFTDISHPKLTIVEGDAWTHEGTYDCAFHDIWPDWRDHEAELLEARNLAPVQVSLPLTYAQFLEDRRGAV